MQYVSTNVKPLKMQQHIMEGKYKKSLKAATKQDAIAKLNIENTHT